jgi:integrase/recombinase XerD
MKNPNLLQHQKWLAEFLHNCENSNKSPRTIINYRADLIKFIIWFETNYQGVPLNKAQAQTIGHYKEFLTQGKNNFDMTKLSNKNILKKIFSRFSFKLKKSSLNPNAPLLTHPHLKGLRLAVSSRRRHLSAIRNFYEFLKQSNEDQNKLFPSNPVKPKLHGIKLKEQDVESTKLLTAKDWEAIENSIYKIREKLIVSLLYWGGLRLSELCQLKIHNFDHTHQSVKFNRKGGYVHDLKLQNGNKIFSLLKIYLQQNPIQSEYLFCNKKGRPISSRSMYTTIIKIFVKSLCPTVGLTPHSFRKACATNLYKKTKDLLFVRDYLNHADAKVTQTYIEKQDFHQQDVQNHYL